MLFYQYTTGRSIEQGYGFVHQSEGLDSIDQASFRNMRDITIMPIDSTVFEIHKIDSKHVTLIMTRVEPFGSAKYCYTSSLISTDGVHYLPLMGLLQRKNFLNSAEFLEQEHAKENGIAMEMKNLVIPENEDVTENGMKYGQVMNADAVYPSLLGYLWKICDQRSRGQRELRPMVLVCPQPDSFDMIQFVRDHVIAYLPQELQSEASLVFHMDPKCMGQIPSNTVCFVVDQLDQAIQPSCNFQTGTVDATDKYIDPVVKALGDNLYKRKFPDIYEHVMCNLPEAARQDYRIAYHLQYLSMLFQQRTRNMKLLSSKIIDTYGKLKEGIANNYSVTDNRLALVPVEREILTYWSERREEKEKTLPEVYRFIAERALTVTEDVWNDYLNIMGKPGNLTEGTEYDVLLEQHHRNICHKRMCQLLLAQLSVEEPYDAAYKTMGYLQENGHDAQDLHERTKEILLQGMNEDKYSDNQLVSILNSNCWTPEEDDCLLKVCLQRLSSDREHIDAISQKVTKKTHQDALIRRKKELCKLAFDEKPDKDSFYELLESLNEDDEKEHFEWVLTAAQKSEISIENEKRYQEYLASMMQRTPEMYASTVAESLSHEKDAQMALWQLNNANKNIGKIAQMEESIFETLKKHIDSLNAFSLSKLFQSKQWVDLQKGEDIRKTILEYSDKKTLQDMLNNIDDNEDCKLIRKARRKKIVDDADINRSAQSLSELTEILEEYHQYHDYKSEKYKEYLLKLLGLLEELDSSEEQVKRVTELIKQQPADVCADEETKRRCFEVYESKNYQQEMWELLEECYKHKYERKTYDNWKVAEDGHIKDIYQREIETINLANAEEVKRFLNSWRDAKCRTYEYPWNELINIKDVKRNTEQKCDTVVKKASASELHELWDFTKNKQNDDWFLEILYEQIRDRLKNDISGVLEAAKSVDLAWIADDELGFIEDSRVSLLRVCSKLMKYNEQSLMQQINKFHLDSVGNNIWEFIQEKIKEYHGPLENTIPIILLEYIGQRENAWEYVLKKKVLQEGTLEKKAQPFGKELYIVQRLHVICEKLDDLDASAEWKKSLHDYLHAESSSWVGFINKMEEEQAAMRFYRNKKADRIELKKWLNI